MDKNFNQAISYVIVSTTSVSPKTTEPNATVGTTFTVRTTTTEPNTTLSNTAPTTTNA